MTEQLVHYLPTIIAVVVILILVVQLLKARENNAQLRVEQGEKGAQLNALTLQVEELQSQLAEKADAVVNFQTQVHLAQQQVSQLQAEKQGTETRLADRDQNIAELKATNSEQVTQIQRMQGIQTELSNELTELKTTLEEKQQSFEQQKADVEKQKQQLKTEFANIANQILEEKGKTFSHSNKVELDAILKPLKEQVEGFQKRVNEVHSESVKGNASLAAELKKVLDVGVQMSDEANNLATALKGEKKTAGNWGEVQLERTLQLAGLVKGDHYETQEKFLDDDGNRK